MSPSPASTTRRRPPARSSRWYRQRLRLIGAGLALAVLAALFAVLASRGHGDQAQAGGGDRAHYDAATHKLSFDLPAFAGGQVSDVSLAGKPAVLNFYASWCTVCRGELPAFQATAQRIGSRVNFVGVNPQSNDTDSGQAAMIRAAGVTYPTVRDRHDALLSLFDTSGSLPVTVFLRADGSVADVHLGGLTADSLAQLLRTDLGISS